MGLLVRKDLAITVDGSAIGFLRFDLVFVGDGTRITVECERNIPPALLIAALGSLNDFIKTHDAPTKKIQTVEGLGL